MESAKRCVKLIFMSGDTSRVKQHKLPRNNFQNRVLCIVKGDSENRATQKERTMKRRMNADIKVLTAVPVIEIDGVRYHHHPNGGGLVAETAEVADRVYVGPCARVCDYSRLSGDVLVFGNAWISGRAEVSGAALVFGHARVFGNAKVRDYTKIYGSARVHGDAVISGFAEALDKADIGGYARIQGNARITGSVGGLGEAGSNGRTGTFIESLLRQLAS